MITSSGSKKKQEEVFYDQLKYNLLSKKDCPRSFSVFSFEVAAVGYLSGICGTRNGNSPVHKENMHNLEAQEGANYYTTI